MSPRALRRLAATAAAAAVPGVLLCSAGPAFAAVTPAAPVKVVPAKPVSAPCTAAVPVTAALHPVAVPAKLAAAKPDPAIVIPHVVDHTPWIVPVLIVVGGVGLALGVSELGARITGGAPSSPV
jgi:hypothetical protein